jgi:hypothetical protein
MGSRTDESEEIVFFESEPELEEEEVTVEEEEEETKDDDDTMTTDLNPEAIWFDGVDPKATKRTEREIETQLAGIAKDQRSKLSAKDMQNLKIKAEEGMDDKFKLMEPIADGTKASADQLKTIYSVQRRIDEFKSTLQAFDMDDVFTIPSAFSTDENGDDRPARTARKLDLFTSSQEVSLEVVKKASVYRATFGQDYHVQNLLWSGTKLLNSCDEKLRQKLLEQTSQWPVYHRSGPVYFKVMVQLILASSAQCLRGLIQQLESLKVTDFNGENVAAYVSFARGAIERLSNNNAVPFDLRTILTDAMSVTSTKAFNDVIIAMNTNHLLGIKSIETEEILQKAEEEYIALVTGNKWEAGTSSSLQDSVFVAGPCYNCGQQGHIAANCGQGGRGGRGGFAGGGRGRGGRFGRGGGRGRGGRGGGSNGRGQGGQQGNAVGYDRRPPKRGEPHERTRNGRTEKWCGRHGYWTWHPGAHTTEECRLQLRENESANVANENHASGSEPEAEETQEGRRDGDNSGGNNDSSSRQVRFAPGTAFHALHF